MQSSTQKYSLQAPKKAVRSLKSTSPVVWKVMVPQVRKSWRLWAVALMRMKLRL